MRKTARPVVWEGAGAQSPAPDPISRQGCLRYHDNPVTNNLWRHRPLAHLVVAGKLQQPARRLQSPTLVANQDHRPLLSLAVVLFGDIAEKLSKKLRGMDTPFYMSIPECLAASAPTHHPTLATRRLSPR
ncbi:MAG: hypothetical protein FJ404_19250 [Verrucomicrobia bacterium]|nr:hypothetical protein [Verrucomicrobiota bacterium]